jgi:transposase-like protein
MAQKRRKFTAQFKFETVMEVLRGEKSVAQSCRERNITEALYYKWRDAFFERAPSVFEDQRSTSTEPPLPAWRNWSGWWDRWRWRM